MVVVHYEPEVHAALEGHVPSEAVSGTVESLVLINDKLGCEPGWRTDRVAPLLVDSRDDHHTRLPHQPAREAYRALGVAWGGHEGRFGFETAEMHALWYELNGRIEAE